MLYAGAVLLEGVILWMLVSGVPGWGVVGGAGVGVLALLLADWILARRTHRT